MTKPGTGKGNPTRRSVAGTPAAYPSPPGVRALARIKLTLPERMTVVRRRLGMSQRELADLLGVSEFTICRNERGVRKGTGRWLGDVAHRWRLIEAKYRLEIEAANGQS